MKNQTNSISQNGRVKSEFNNNNDNYKGGHNMTPKRKKYPHTIQLDKLKINTPHPLKRILSENRFGLTEKQLNKISNYNFREFDKNSYIVKMLPYLKRKLWEGNRYFKNEHLNMFLCVSKYGYLITVLKLKGTDYSDYNNRKGWGDSIYY